MASLIFDFPSPGSGEPARVAYRDPVRTVMARTTDQVRDAVAEVERAVAGGLHAAGFIAYEAGPAFEPRMRVRGGNRLPLVWFGLFEGPSMAPGSSPGAPSGPNGPRPTDPGPAFPGAWNLEVDRPGYDAAVATVREAIADGRTYQVNLTARLRATVGASTLDPVRLYESLRRAQGSGWHALLDLGRQVIVSVSPELFFRTAGRRIETRPMKGTRPRGRWPAEDETLAAELAGSEKDRAENLMIVDLLRSDLGRVCETGSIRVPQLFDVERYRTVWQMTSRVEGQLRADVTLADLLDALFPCGSVTGAPKISTMAVIAELETSPREVYCGAIGLVRPGGDMAFNVPIRTLWWDRETGVAEYGTGGGIVWDSTPESEYDELLAKAVVVREPWPEFRLLETMATGQGAVLRADRHMDRLRRSAAYFGYPFTQAAIRRTLDDHAVRTAGPARLRLTLAEDGAFEVECEALEDVGASGPTRTNQAPRPVSLADTPVDSGDRFLYHKTTHRQVYEARRSAAPAGFDTLLWNERGEVTEFTRGNVVVELDGDLFTPPLASGLLPGCLRAELLETDVIVERVVTRQDLARATRMWFINSARGWIEVALPPTGRSPRGG